MECEKCLKLFCENRFEQDKCPFSEQKQALEKFEACKNYFYNKLSNDSCTGCDFYKECVRHKKDKEMEKQKFQFESEEADIFIADVIIPFIHPDSHNNEMVKEIKEYMKQNGYIRKSELLIIVDEAEEMYYGWMKLNENVERYNREQLEIMLSQNKAIQALKKSHPEYNK